MKHILLFGAGKSATILIEYLIQLAWNRQWKVTIADSDPAAIAEKTSAAPLLVQGVVVALENEQQRNTLIDQADLVISLMPPALHFLIAQNCLAAGKHLLTASYADAQMQSLAVAVKQKGLLFLNEMGLDPGIDHMSAMRLIDQIQSQGGVITSFLSHCGGLVAPESDNNPWHYKISWNPRNIVMAGKAGALYIKNGDEQHEPYEELFKNNLLVAVPDLTTYACYPNRDSLAYRSLYNLPEADTFIRTTLRHPDFCAGWHYLISLYLTDEEKVYETDHLSLHSFFLEHKKRFAHKITHLPEPSPLIQQQLEYLGLFEESTLINKGLCSAADILQWLLETRLQLLPNDRDMIIMVHEITYTLHQQKHHVQSSLIVKGENALHTAMARTVGLPLGIAASLVLDGRISQTGLHIPVSPAFYIPVLQKLEKMGITFTEREQACQ